MRVALPLTLLSVCVCVRSSRQSGKDERRILSILSVEVREKREESKRTNSKDT